MKKYYYVYRVGNQVPTVKHATLEQAEAEATRLATQHPGSDFELLECLGIVQTVKPQTFWMDGVIPPHICAMHRIMDDTCFICGDKVGGES